MSGRQRTVVRGALALLLIGAVAAYYAWGGRDLLSLDSLKTAKASLSALVAADPITAVLLYLAVYAVLLAVALPVSGVLTIAGGALFGWAVGAALASLAATLGATLCMLAARFVARGPVRRRWPGLAKRVDEGVRLSGGTYLVSLRLAPGIPFVLINLAMGLTAMHPLRFALWTLLGGVPVTLIYAYAGQRLATLESVREVLSPGLVMAFFTLAALPLAGKALLNRRER